MTEDQDTKIYKRSYVHEGFFSAPGILNGLMKIFVGLGISNRVKMPKTFTKVYAVLFVKYRLYSVF